MGHHTRALADELRAESADGAVCSKVFIVDGDGLCFEVLSLLHALERPDQVYRGGPALRQDLVRLFASLTQNKAESGGAADRRGAANHHVADRLRQVRGAGAGDVLGPTGQQPLVEELEPIALPTDRLHFPGHQTTRSLAPSTATRAPVLWAKSAPHISAASSATSFEVTSVPRRLFFLYCATVRL